MRSAKATAMVAPLLLLVALCLSGARCLPESGPLLHHDKSGSSASASASARAISKAEPYGFSQAVAKASARADSNDGGSSKASASAQASSKSNGGRLLLGDPPGTATAVARVLPVGSYTASCDTCKLSAGGILRCDCLGATSRRTSLLDTSGSCPNVANCGGQLQCTRDCATVTPRPTVTPAGPYARTCQGCYWVSATKFYCTTCVDDEGEVWAEAGPIVRRRHTVPRRERVSLNVSVAGAPASLPRLAQSLKLALSLHRCPVDWGAMQAAENLPLLADSFKPLQMPSSGRGTDCAVAVCGLQDEERQGDCDGGPASAAGGPLLVRCQVPSGVRSVAATSPLHSPLLHHDKSGSSASASASARAISKAEPYGFSQAVAKASARADSNDGGSSKASASAQASSKSNGGRLLLGDPPGTATAVARVLPVGSYTASCDTCKLSAGGILRCDCLGATSRRTSLLDTSGSCPNVANCGGQLQCTRDCATVTPRPTVTPAGPYARTCQGCYWVSATKFYCTTCVDDEGEVWMRSAKATAMVAPLLLLVALCLSGARCLPESGPLLHHDKSGSSASASASARAISKAEPYGFSQAVAKASARADSNDGGSSKASASAQASSKSNGGRLLLGDPPGTATAVARVLPVGSYTASCDTCKLSAGGILRCDCLGATSRRTSLLDTSGSCPNVANCGGQLQCTRDCATVTPRPTVTPAGPYARTCQGCYWVSATKFYCTTCVDDEGEVWSAWLSGARSCPSVLNCDGVLKCNSC
ncbi:hypothetical protein QJQ45_018242 [Haematococcus lacustris]|nr:hypothetical protein QJQ45_018242 [Haematococcus lacustris]